MGNDVSVLLFYQYLVRIHVFNVLFMVRFTAVPVQNSELHSKIKLLVVIFTALSNFGKNSNKHGDCQGICRSGKVLNKLGA